MDCAKPAVQPGSPFPNNKIYTYVETTDVLQGGPSPDVLILGQTLSDFYPFPYLYSDVSNCARFRWIPCFHLYVTSGLRQNGVASGECLCGQIIGRLYTGVVSCGKEIFGISGICLMVVGLVPFWRTNACTHFKPKNT